MGYLVCQCPPGPCEHYPYQAIGRYHQFRNHTSGLPRWKEEYYLQLLASRHDPNIPIPLPSIGPRQELVPNREYKPARDIRDGVGTELKLLIESLGLEGYEGCGCASVIRWMNTIGLEGCEKNFDTIVAKLRKQQQKLKWSEWLSASWKAIKSGPSMWFDPSDPAPGMVREAIRRWREKHPEGS